MHVDASYTEYGRTDIDHADVRLSDGQAVAYHLTSPNSGSALEIVVVGGKTYVKAPGHARTPSRPWVVAAPSDPDTTIANLAGSPRGTLLDDSLAEYVQLAEDAVSISPPDPTHVDGRAATRYRLLLDNAKTPFDALGAFPNSQIAPLPVDIYLDAQGHPIRVATSTRLGGKPAALLIRFSRFDAPTHITAPAAQTIGPS